MATLRPLFSQYNLGVSFPCHLHRHVALVGIPRNQVIQTNKILKGQLSTSIAEVIGHVPRCINGVLKYLTPETALVFPGVPSKASFVLRPSLWVGNETDFSSAIALLSKEVEGKSTIKLP
jgi:hypothetical protein